MTTGAQHFGSDHTEAVIGAFYDSLRIDFFAEAGPATSGVKFSFGFEQGVAATHAVVLPGFPMLFIFSGVGTLGSVLS